MKRFCVIAQTTFRSNPFIDGDKIRDTIREQMGNPPRRRRALNRKEYNKQRYKKRYLRDKALGRTKLWKRPSKTARGEKQVAFRFGLTAEQVSAKLKEQGGACAICGIAFTSTPMVDHCHSSGIVRGLLCKKCNAALGFFGENVGALRNAILYLETYKVIAEEAIQRAESQLEDLKNLP